MDTERMDQGCVCVQVNMHEALHSLQGEALQYKDRLTKAAAMCRKNCTCLYLPQMS